ncbi:hypothetical protein LINPERHAP2_LOCUS37164, partial [Linum perenne]
FIHPSHLSLILSQLSSYCDQSDQSKESLRSSFLIRAKEMDYMFGDVPEGVSVGPSDPSILWGDSDRHRA